MERIYLGFGEIHRYAHADGTQWESTAAAGISVKELFEEFMTAGKT